MPTRNSTAVWEGDLKRGNGKMKLGSGAFEGKYSYGTRFENEKGTNPEELIAAAHAGCFSMAFAMLLGEEGYQPREIHTTASVTLEVKGDEPKISGIKLTSEGHIPEIKEDKFQELADMAKENCPVSKLLTGAPVELEANLVQHATAPPHE